jgi:2-polyprenyl-3-methyl-5-hydroxy-6-metoxy-1,4-benzoquinol methylase
VAELTQIVGVAQSRVSAHLARLRDGAVLRDRKAGAATYYQLDTESMSDDVTRVWSLVSRSSNDTQLSADTARADAIVAARTNTRTWPESVAGQMEAHYSPGRTWESMARGLLGLLHLGDVLDAGCGDGTVSEMVRAHARSLTCLDASETMISAAKARLSDSRTPADLRFDVGDVQALPYADASFDEVLLFHVLPHVAAPAKVIAECARVLRPAGTLAIATLAAHEHADIVRSYGQLNHGIAPAALAKLLTRAGLTVTACDVAHRERRAPYFEVITAFARRPASHRATRGSR